MTNSDSPTIEDISQEIEHALSHDSITLAAKALQSLRSQDVVQLMHRLDFRNRAVVYRLLPKDRALAVFEMLQPRLQADLVHALHDEEVTGVFAEMDPDDRATLLDELPAGVATRLLRNLPESELELTSIVLGYPANSIGRRMSPEFVSAYQDATVAETLIRVRSRIDDAETIYTIPVVNRQRKLVGVLDLSAAMRADHDTSIAEIMDEPYSVPATESAERAAIRCSNLRVLALPVVDDESRLVGILTVDDALSILEDAQAEDQARISGSEPLRRPYLATPVRSIVKSRVVWLLVLAIGATITVQVLEVFEATIEQMVVLSLFVPLLIGTGGNTGNQAATTVTRALAVGDVRPRDVFKVIAREIRVGLTLGLLLGTLGFAITSIFYGVAIGLVIGLTLMSICTLAAAVGGGMPLVATKIGVDPAVFANPFITTLVDATGLVIYFLIARAVLGL